MNTRYLGVFVILVIINCISACSHLTYYGQAIRGHFDLMVRRESVDAILSDPSRDPRLLTDLRLAKEIREFASREMGLPDNGSYHSYVDTGRPYVTWAVYAAPHLSLSPKLWCFPIAGCVPYRGYFSEQAALAESKALRAIGMDTYVVGVAAYSTLGWFDDPLLNTMLLRSEMGLAGLIFHELAHQRLYVANDTGFNEAFAVAVQQIGTRRWLRHKRSEDDLQALEKALQRQHEFYELVTEIKQELAMVYKSNQNERQQLISKQEIVASAGQRYALLKKQWHGDESYDAWFDEPINNAKLAATVFYLDAIPAFTRLLEACDGNPLLFYFKVERIAELPEKIRRAQLERGEGC